MFITFEGLDGSGKTTQIQYLINFLQDNGHHVHATREPGGTPIGDAIRHVLHDMKHAEMHPHAEVLLYVASRAQLVNQIIRPLLQDNAVVVSDRFADSTLAYQGYGHGLPVETLQQIVLFATGGLRPDLTLYLDVDVELGLKRRHIAASKGEEYNRLDSQGQAFYERVYEGYQALIAAEPERWVVVDARLTPAEVAAQIREIVSFRLAQ